MVYSIAFAIWLSTFFPVTALHNMARNKLNNITSQQTFSHTNSDGCDLGCRRRIFAPQIKFVSENLSRGTYKYCSKKYIYEQWRKSPSHNAVLNEKNIKWEVFLIKEENGVCTSILLRAR
jgi:hypothetical protein